MPIVVQKYGGSSVADVEKIRRVAEHVRARRDAGYQLVVVVSAMGDTTDELLGLAKQVSPNPPRRELDMLLTCGERISMALLSMALHELAVPAISFTGSQSGIITDDAHAQARIVEVRPVRIHEELDRGKVVIVAGYQGVSRNREVTTLGRGGSDTTAVALAAALDAEACEIYSDVDGVFSADPRVVESAQKLATLTYEEMQELAHGGARVLNAQAVEFAREKGIVIHAKSAHGGGSGSRVEAGSRARATKAIAVTSDSEVAALFAVGSRAARALPELLASRGYRARFFSLSARGKDESAIAVLPLQDVHGIAALKEDLQRSFGADITWGDDVATVTVVGTGVGADWQHLRRAFDLALGSGPVFAVHTSLFQVSVLVPKAHASKLTQTLHRVMT